MLRRSLLKETLATSPINISWNEKHLLLNIGGMEAIGDQHGSVRVESCRADWRYVHIRKNDTP
jgi:hypothetical protein